MVKIKDKIQELKGRYKWLRILLNKYIIVFFVFIIIIFFIDKNNVIKWIINERNIYQQEKLIRQYQREIRDIDKRLQELTSNLDSLERFARENYYFQKGDEEVFIIK